MSAMELTLHSFTAYFVDALVVRSVKDIWLVWRVDHADVPSTIDEEAELFEVRWEGRVRLHGFFYTPEHVDAT